jgi:HPt (histidine-containing phosphotransfer) domain-containing protein
MSWFGPSISTAFPEHLGAKIGPLRENCVDFRVVVAGNGREVLAALSHVDGDAALLREIADLFLGDYPQRMAEIQAAIATDDGQALMRAAHSLKGVAGTFAAKATYEAAQRLETMGENGDLLAARDAYTALETEMSRLTGVLARLGK